MWHEARRQERKIRGMLVDYRRRAERRRDFYEKIKADPTQFLQIHGRQCKIHLDPAIASAADNAVMMPWQGQAENLIDRFDVRAHLDYIPPVGKEEIADITQEERQINYERYRIIAQNSFLGVTEEKFLKQLHLEEQFGYTETKSKKEPRTGGAAIGFNYEDPTPGPVQMFEPNEEESDDNSDSDLDVDLAINVSKMDPSQAHEMNKHGRNFGMSSNDFYSFLTNDLEEAETYRLAKEEEHEKALFSGRKSRRERRAHREKRLANRVISPPSYAARTSPTYPTFRESKSVSKSPSPEVSGKITYITSFGGEDDASSSRRPTYADKVKQNKFKESTEEKVIYYANRNRSRSNEKNFSRKRRRSRSRSRSRSRRSPNHVKSRSRSRRSRSRSRSRRSKTRSRDRYRRSNSSSRDRRSYRSRRRHSSSSFSSSSTSRSASPPPKKQRTPPSSSSSNSPVATNKMESESPKKKESPPKVVSRYYGRKKSDQSSSDSSDSSTQQDVDMRPAYNPVNSDVASGYGKSGSSIKKAAIKLTIQERLKRKRQALLNKQFKADKIAEQLKTEREKQEQQTREDELREMAIKLRRRQREKRHAYDSNRSSSDSDSDSNSKSRTSSNERNRKSYSSSPKSKSAERERKRDHPRESSKEKREDRRDHKVRSRERSRDKRSYSTERKDVKRDRSKDSPIRRSNYRDGDKEKKDKARNEKDKKKDDRASKALVDY